MVVFGFEPRSSPGLFFQNNSIVKVVYTILFFVNTLLLLLLTYATVQFVDEGVDYLKIGMMAVAILICIFILAYLLLQYIKIPSSGRKEF